MRVHVPKNLHDLREKGEHFFHATYLGFTYYEGHGWHANAAGILFILVAIGVFVHGDTA